MSYEIIILLLTSLPLYIYLAQTLRFRRRDAIQSRFKSRPLSSMTVEEAHQIIRELRELEFPYTLHTAMKISLLKTASIPTMTKLFLATGQLNARNASKHAADTEVVLSEVHDRLPGSDAHLLGIARMNYLHARYRKAGKILDEDMLHTLGSAVVDIVRSVERYEWRGLSGVERCAVGVFHRALGDAMGIPFGMLESSKQGWRDGGHFVEEICGWTLGYEKRVVRRTEANVAIGGRLMGLATVNVPVFMRGVVERAVAMKLDGHVREGMGFEEPGVVLSSLVHGIMALRKFILRYLSLPRPGFMAVRVLSDTPEASGLYTTKLWIADPWYVKPTFLHRWGPKALLIWLFGGAVPAVDGPYRGEGYDLWNIGPAAQEKRGREEMEVLFEGLKEGNFASGCPFHSGI